MSDNENTEKGLSVWNNVLTAALKLPGAKINRESFLKKELSKYYSDEIVKEVIEHGYKNASVDKKHIDAIAKSIVATHTTLATSISFAAGLPGGWFLAGTIPADLAQFYFHVIVVAQKLAYIYGWPSFAEDEPTDQFLGLLTLFIGVMSGTKAASAALGKMANSLAQNVVKRLPGYALTKFGVFNLTKQIAKWFGVNLTKQSFAKGVSKVIPVLGGVISGGLTVATFLPMANKLKKYLQKLPLAKDGEEYSVNEEDLNI